MNDKLNKGLPTIPSTIKEELECNIFLRSEEKSVQKNLNLNNTDSLQTFSKLRDLRDNF
jgi:hydroxyacylglutathione hydrolase